MKQTNCPLVYMVTHAQIQMGGGGASLMTMRQANPVLLAQLLCEGVKMEITVEAERGKGTTKVVSLIFSEKTRESDHLRKGMLAAKGLNLRMARRAGKRNVGEEIRGVERVMLGSAKDETPMTLTREPNMQKRR